MEELSGLLAQYGLVLVFVNVLLTQGGAPVPATPMLILAGALIAKGQLAFGSVLCLAVVATIMGNVPWYFAGRRYGYPILRSLCRVSIEPDSCIKQTEDIFIRWGALSLIVGKYIPGFATIAPPLAGAMKLEFPLFLLYTTVSAVLWAVVPMLAGMIFHTEVEWLLARLESMGAGVVAIAALIITVYIAFKLIQRYLLIRFLRMVRISVAEFRDQLLGNPPPVVLDVRSALARKLDPRGIPGAIWMDMADSRCPASDLSQDRDVVVYCSCPNEASAARVARLLMNRGYKRVRPLEGGLEAWVAAGGQVQEIEALLERSDGGPT